MAKEELLFDKAEILPGGVPVSAPYQSFTIPDRSTHSNREYKASTFTTYFSEPENAAELFCALGHEEMEVKPEDITFTTLQGVLFMARRNDLAFTAKKRILVIGEHQSTANENMPLEKTAHPMLNLEVRQININPSAGHPLLEKSRCIYEYAFFIERIRGHLRSGAERQDAIRYAMEECVREGIMTDFIRRHGSEVRNMLFTEFNLEDFLEVRGEERYEDGVEDGMNAGEAITLIKFVCRKLKKGKEAEQIAEDLDEDLGKIKQICQAAESFAPDYDPKEIYKKLAEN